VDCIQEESIDLTASNAGRDLMRFHSVENTFPLKGTPGNPEDEKPMEILQGTRRGI